MGIVSVAKIGNHGRCDYYPNKANRVKCGKVASYKVLDGLVAGNEYCATHIKAVKSKLPGVKVRAL